MKNSLRKMPRQNLFLFAGLLAVLALNTSIKAAPLTSSPLVETNLEDIRITHTFTSPAMVFGTVDRGESKLNTFYVLTPTTTSLWNKTAFSCVQAAARSNDGKHIWVVSNVLADSSCILAYQISHSADGGKTWKTSNDFNPSGRFSFLSFGLTNQGTGQLVLAGQPDGEEAPMKYYTVAIAKFGESMGGLQQSGRTPQGWTTANLAATVFTDFSGDLSRGDEARRRKIFANVKNPGPQ